MRSAAPLRMPDRLSGAGPPSRRPRQKSASWEGSTRHAAAARRTTVSALAPSGTRSMGAPGWSCIRKSSTSGIASDRDGLTRGMGCSVQCEIGS